MLYDGVILGLATIGIFEFSHKLVIWGEYYWGRKVWCAFLAVGLASLLGSMLVKDVLYAAILAVWGFCCLWGIGEVIKQTQRVAKGWFPKNPKRSYPRATRTAKTAAGATHATPQ